MPLHLAHHKSYHPYNQANIEKIRQDEDEQRKIDHRDEERGMVADADARVTLLRARRIASGIESTSNEKSSAAMPDLVGSPSSSSHNHRQLRQPHQPSDQSRSDGGHINFWADAERRGQQSSSTAASSRKRTNPDYESEKRQQQEKLEGLISTRLGMSSEELHPWYGNEDLQDARERKKTSEQKLEEAYKESIRKSSHDPLRVMSSFLAQREQALDNTAASSKRKWRDEGTEREVLRTSRTDAPQRRNSETESDPVRAAARARATAERARAQALFADRHKHQVAQVNPKDRYQAYSDQYSSADVLAAKHSRTAKWSRASSSLAAVDTITGGRSLQRDDFDQSPSSGASYDEQQLSLSSPSLSRLFAPSSSINLTFENSAVTRRSHLTMSVSPQPTTRDHDDVRFASQPSSLRKSSKEGDALVEGIDISEANTGLAADASVQTLRAQIARAADTTIAVESLPAPTTLELPGTDAPVSVHDQRDRPGASDDGVNSASAVDEMLARRESMYPSILCEMIATVLEKEAYLFSTEELALLTTFPSLSYNSRYIFARLVQRKDRWQRARGLQYLSEADTARAVSELSACIASTTDTAKETSLDRYLITEEGMDTGAKGLLAMLSLDELKALSQKMAVKAKKSTREEIIKALLATSGQSTLMGMFGNAIGSSSGSKKKSVRELSLSWDSKGRKLSQTSLVVQQATLMIGHCIKIPPTVRALLNRVALVYYRATISLGTNMITPSVLVRSRRRNYPAYSYSRSSHLFVSRERLLAYEQALDMEERMEQLVEGGGPGFAAMQEGAQLLELAWPLWTAAVESCRAESVSDGAVSAYHLRRFNPGWPLTRLVYKGAHCLARLKEYRKEETTLRALLDQREFRRGKRGSWYDRLALILATYSDDKVVGKNAALAVALAGIADPDTHLIFLDTLQRRIVRLEKQLDVVRSQRHDFEDVKLKKCTDALFEGVQLDVILKAQAPQNSIDSYFDVDARDRSAPDPSRERSLSGSPNKSTGVPATSPTQRAPLLKSVTIERLADADAVPDGSGLTPPEPRLETSRLETRRSMATVWRGLDLEPCSVEDLVLQHYVRDGWQGRHCEGRMLTMLFTLLHWDVIFDRGGEGIFETAFQHAPLDISEDSFYHARAQAFTKRLTEIRVGGPDFFLELIENVHEREAPRKTFALGCRWDTYTLRELLELAVCLGGEALAFLCKHLAQEWGHCTSGMPDLILWKVDEETAISISREMSAEAQKNASEGAAASASPTSQGDPQLPLRHSISRSGSVRFCEVKSANDRLSETQKVWIDILLRANVDVSVSHVRAVGGSGSQKERKRSATPAGSKRKMSSLGDDARSSITLPEAATNAKAEYLNDLKAPVASNRHKERSASPVDIIPNSKRTRPSPSP